MVICSLLIALGCGMRIISKSKKIATPLIHSGQFLIGLGGAIGKATPTVLSITWFPSYQRTTATAVAGLSIGTGASLSFLIGPSFVEDVSKYDRHINRTVIVNDAFVKRIEQEIMMLLYVLFGISAGLLLLTILTFQDIPPLPPSISASMPRVNYKEGFASLLSNPQFQILSSCFGISTGIYTGWSTDLALVLSEFNIHDHMAGWIGFSGTIAAIVGGVLFSRLVYNGGGKIFTCCCLSSRFFSMPEKFEHFLLINQTGLF